MHIDELQKAQEMMEKEQIAELEAQMKAKELELAGIS